MVGQLVLKQKRDANFLKSLHDVDILDQNVKGILCNTTERLMLENVKINNATVIQNEIDERHKLEIPLPYIYKTLKEDFGMKYCKVKKIAIQANSIRNRSMRQQFGKIMIKKLNSGVRILNIDETWIGRTNFIRSRW